MPRPVGHPVDYPPEDYRRWYLNPQTTDEARRFARLLQDEWDRTIAERDGVEPTTRKRRTKAEIAADAAAQQPVEMRLTGD